MILLYSGGLDSTVLLHKYIKEIKLVLIFSYGSKHNKKENQFAVKNCKKLNIPYKKIKLNFEKFGISSNLLNKGEEIPDGHYEDESMRLTVVPFRNAIMLSIAVAISESNNINRIAIANHKGDHAIYPDCRENFINKMNEAIKEGTYNNINIFAPFTNITKREIALMGKDLKIDFEKTYSCYKGGKIHCGKCGTCNERKEALKGFDKTQYLL